MKTPTPRGGDDPFEAMNNFTPRAQQVLALARRQADRFNHNFVGTEHLLLGLIALGQGTAVAVLGTMGLDLETVRKEVEKQVGTGPDQEKVGNIPYTPRVKTCLALAAREARALNHTYVGTEHILLGLLREGDGVAARVLTKLGVDIEITRNHILRELDPNFAGAPDAAAPPKKLEPPEPVPESVDTGKRYDIYCSEGNQTVVYRNAMFKGTKKLLSRGDYGGFYQFLEIEQADGQAVFIARTSLIKFCEHGVTPGPEKVQ
jgi:ATP-dependent Clp protease ATP-binding subunit ClpA